jgi:outer membrane receptor protein involved in Fe transport
VNNQRMRKRLLAVMIASLAGGMSLPEPAYAQSTSATIRGQTAANAGITATNTASGLTRRVEAGADGDYVLIGLPPGTYRIDATTPSGVTSQVITVRVGQSATLNLPIDDSQAASPDENVLEEVLVTGTVLAETKTSEISTYITPKQIEALPQGSRNFLAFADIVPGMQFTTNANGTSQLRSGAQSSNGVNVFVDGVGQKNYVLKGGVSGQDQSRGNPFPQLGIAEYKVITSNYKAEFDQLSSAAVVAVTRSGTNEFEGSVFYDYTDVDWRAGTPFENSPGQKKAESEDEQYGFAFGGPIIKDTLHFFMTYERKNIDSPREVRIDQGYTIDQLPDFLQDQIVSYTAPFEEDLFFGKLSWTPGEDHLVELSTKYRDETGIAIDSGAITPSRAKRDQNDDTRVDLRYQFNTANWLNDAHLTYEDSFWAPQSNLIEPGYILTTRRGDNDEVILNAGGGADYQNKGQKGWGVQDDLTYFGWAGHTVKGGIKFKSVEVNSLEQQPFNPQFRYDIDQSITDPWRVNFNASLVAGDRTIVSKNKQFGIYLQDDWEVNSKLTLNYGLRWDYEETPGYLDYVTDPGIAAALRGWSNIQNANYDIEDYIANGSNRDAFKDAFQPRVGFSYDLMEDERHVIFGGAGRAYDRNLFDYLALEQSKHTFPSYERRFNVAGHECEVGVGNCIEWDPRYLDPAELAALVADTPNLGAEVNMINNDLKTPYSDQFSIGMRNAFGMFGHDWNSSVTLAHIRSKDGIVFTLGNRWPGGNFHENPGQTWGGQPWGQPIPGYGTLILADNGIETRLNSLLLSLDKPYTEDSGWGVTVAYTFSDSEENRFNAANFDEHYLFDAESIEGQPFLRSSGIARHRLVTTGIVDAPWGIVVSSKLVLASPATKDATNCRDVDMPGNCFFDPYTPSGTFGFKQFDLAAEKVFAFGSGYSFRLRADILNVFNWKNWTDFDTWRGDAAAANANFGNRSGLGTNWPPRLFKLSLGFTW